MIKIPQHRAIELLEARFRDLENPATDLRALKERIKADTQAIFGPASPQSFTAISLETPYNEDPVKLAKIKINYKQTIQNYIDYINDFEKINKEKIEISEEEFKGKYNSLLDEWNNLVPEYNAFLKDNKTLRKNLDTTLSENRILEEKLSKKTTFNEVIKILFLGASPSLARASRS